MALSRKFLKGMNLTDEQVDSIIEAHAETVNGQKADIERLQNEVERLQEAAQELDDLKAHGNDRAVEKYEKVKKEFDEYRQATEAKETKAAKESAVRAYYQSKGITGKSLDIAMRGSGAEINGVELEDGKIKDTTQLDGLIGGDFAGLVTRTEVTGAQTATPPANNGGNSMTREEILRIKNTRERQKAIADNAELFGIK